MVIDYVAQSNNDLVTLEYINSLYRIELLRNADIREVTNLTAWQFGQMSLAPWKDDNHCINDFRMSHEDSLMMFNSFKIGCAIKKLSDGLMKFESPLYTSLPLAPQLFDSLHALFKSTFKTEVLNETFVQDDSVLRNVNSFGLKPEDFDIHLADRLIKNEFNSFKEDRVDLDTASTRKTYGVNRHALLDNKTFYNWTKVKRCVDKMYDRTVNDKGIVFKKWSKGQNAAFFASLFSVLYHLRVPATIHPNSLDRLYEKYILTHELASDGLQFARKFGAFRPMDVIACRILPMNSKQLNAFWEQKNLAGGNYTPDSTVERYLITQYILESITKKIDI